VAYVGTLIGKTAATLGLLAASTHTAVWLGASTPDASRWIQAGLEGDRPYAYVEAGRGGRQVSLREWPVAPGHLARVRLQRRGDRWRVLIDGRRSRWRTIPRAVPIATLETDGPAAALIDGRLVRGG
jgi:hypothetical protein